MPSAIGVDATNVAPVTTNVVTKNYESPTEISESSNDDLIQLKDEDVFQVSFQDTKFYSEKTKGGKDSAFAGQKYFMFSYNGVNFTTRSELFFKAFTGSDFDVYSIILKKGDGGIEFVSFVPNSARDKFLDLKQSRAYKAKLNLVRIKQLDMLAELAPTTSVLTDGDLAEFSRA